MLPQVFAALQASSSVIDLIGDRIYRHGEAPEGVADPYVTWFVVAAPPENTLDGAPRVDRFEIQVDCWGDNSGTGDAGVEELAQLVRDVLEVDHHMTGIVVNGRDPETKRPRIGMAFTWFQHRDSVDDLGFPQSS